MHAYLFSPAKVIKDKMDAIRYHRLMLLAFTDPLSARCHVLLLELTQLLINDSPAFFTQSLISQVTWLSGGVAGSIRLSLDEPASHLFTRKPDHLTSSNGDTEKTNTDKYAKKCCIGSVYIRVI